MRRFEPSGSVASMNPFLPNVGTSKFCSNLSAGVVSRGRQATFCTRKGRTPVALGLRLTTRMLVPKDGERDDAKFWCLLSTSARPVRSALILTLWAALRAVQIVSNISTDLLEESFKAIRST
eukprot:4814537-Pyramimonas_sp.AAC.1